MLRDILAKARDYSLFARLIGATRGRQLFVQRHIRPRTRDRVFDFGSRPADILEAFPSGVVSLLLAGPGVLATLTLALLVIQLFSSARFEPAVEILRWNCLGMMLRVASWPMGFILLAKGEGKIFFWSELLASGLGENRTI